MSYTGLDYNITAVQALLLFDVTLSVSCTLAPYNYCSLSLSLSLSLSYLLFVTYSFLSSLISFPSSTSSSLSVYPTMCFLHKSMSNVAMQSLIFISSSWSSPAACMWMAAKMKLYQNSPLPAVGRFSKYNFSTVNDSSLQAKEYQFTNILARYHERNCKYMYPLIFNTRDGSSTSVLVLENALSTFSEELDGAFKQLSTCLTSNSLDLKSKSITHLCLSQISHQNHKSSLPWLKAINNCITCRYDKIVSTILFS